MPEPQRPLQPLERNLGRQSIDRQSKRLPANRQAISKSIKRIPRTNSFPLPLWLRLLVSTQKLSIAMTVMLTISVFVIYGWTVYAQDKWNQQYEKLEQLKRQERQLTTAAGAFENDALRAVQKSPGQLVRERPEQSIFIQAAPLRPKREVPETVSGNVKSPTDERLGY